MVSNRWKFISGLSAMAMVLGVVMAVFFSGLAIGSSVSASENPRIEKAGSIIIDCIAPPFIPRDSKVLEHRKGEERFVWDPAEVTLFLSPEQEDEIVSGGPRDGRTISGEDLRKLLADKPVLNANVLDFLLAHPDLIPGEWKGRSVFFWGTIYSGFLNTSYVRALRWDEHEQSWIWHHGWLVYEWDFGGPALMLKI